MQITVANPIYDTVFKYLMADERIAKTILSALLKKEVRKVEMRPHEYSNTSRDTLSVFRIDFSATIVDETGKERIITIELQKTWLPTETLRFRQYLALQYNDQKNIQSTTKKYAYPLVAVYLLGHRVGNLEAPVVYVDHKVYNYDGQEVPNGSNNPFVESLTHNSIIVQIPLLRGKVHNRLDQVLSLFDQSKIADARNSQILTLEETDYKNDADLMYMIHRLTAAAANAEMRQDMNVEDEYYQVIEDRDTEILAQKKKLKEQQAQLSQKDAQLTQKDAQLSQKDAQIRTLVETMSHSGISADTIAAALSISVEEVHALLANS